MKNFLKNAKNGLIFGFFASIMMIISFIIFIKARTTTNPTPTDDGIGMYTAAGGTLTAAKWNNLVNRSAFRAYLAGSDTVNSTASQVSMDTEVFDTNDEYDPATYKFTPKRAGKYFLTASCAIGGLSTGYGGQVYIYKNGVVSSNGTRGAIDGTYSAASNIVIVSSIEDANVGDYFEVYCRTNKAAGTNLLTGKSTRFEGFKIE